ncbi:hypothetical protein GFB56_12460 [Ensifer sp. T173]|uniref:Uncharacterized protein n=1 Tax=Ensifer canadensis TaxID=555315 RepID=A0AAW4FN80_9HYPH|nr:hypothetical protein [Ensifer canadensis]MBM3091625.1 hypothetical protein [Ensifer canadensis]UBI74387.1 hypothetical protein J3R84_12890 [Ensifer canadensis]
MIDVLLELFGYTTARLVLPIITLGKVRVQPIASADRGFSWLGFKRVADGSLMCRADMAGLIGVLLWLLTAVLFFVSP